VLDLVLADLPVRARHEHPHDFISNKGLCSMLSSFQVAKASLVYPRGGILGRWGIISGVAQ
jgi:hypothetical protein